MEPGVPRGSSKLWLGVSQNLGTNSSILTPENIPQFIRLLISWIPMRVCRFCVERIAYLFPFTEDPHTKTSNLNRNHREVSNS
jgi:hypothetical protein